MSENKKYSYNLDASFRVPRRVKKQNQNNSQVVIEKVKENDEKTNKKNKEIKHKDKNDIIQISNNYEVDVSEEDFFHRLSSNINKAKHFNELIRRILLSLMISKNEYESFEQKCEKHSIDLIKIFEELGKKGIIEIFDSDMPYFSENEKKDILKGYCQSEEKIDIDKDYGGINLFLKRCFVSFLNEKSILSKLFVEEKIKIIIDYVNNKYEKGTKLSELIKEEYILIQKSLHAIICNEYESFKQKCEEQYIDLSEIFIKLGKEKIIEIFDSDMPYFTKEEKENILKSYSNGNIYINKDYGGINLFLKLGFACFLGKESLLSELFVKEEIKIIHNYVNNKYKKGTKLSDLIRLKLENKIYEVLQSIINNEKIKNENIEYFKEFVKINKIRFVFKAFDILEKTPIIIEKEKIIEIKNKFSQIFYNFLNNNSILHFLEREDVEIIYNYISNYENNSEINFGFYSLKYRAKKLDNLAKSFTKRINEIKTKNSNVQISDNYEVDTSEEDLEEQEFFCCFLYETLKTTKPSNINEAEHFNELIRRILLSLMIGENEYESFKQKCEKHSIDLIKIFKELGKEKIIEIFDSDMFYFNESKKQSILEVYKKNDIDINKDYGGINLFLKLGFACFLDKESLLSKLFVEEEIKIIHNYVNNRYNKGTKLSDLMKLEQENKNSSIQIDEGSFKEKISKVTKLKYNDEKIEEEDKKDSEKGNDYNKNKIKEETKEIKKIKPFLPTKKKEIKQEKKEENVFRAICKAMYPNFWNGEIREDKYEKSYYYSYFTTKLGKEEINKIFRGNMEFISEEDKKNFLEDFEDKNCYIENEDKDKKNNSYFKNWLYINDINLILKRYFFCYLSKEGILSQLFEKQEIDDLISNYLTPKFNMGAKIFVRSNKNKKEVKVQTKEEIKEEIKEKEVKEENKEIKQEIKEEDKEIKEKNKEKIEEEIKEEKTTIKAEEELGSEEKEILKCLKNFNNNGNTNKKTIINFFKRLKTYELKEFAFKKLSEYENLVKISKDIKKNELLQNRYNTKWKK